MNVMDEYIKLTGKHINKYMKLIFANNFDKQICEDYLDTYIDVRYYNVDESNRTLKSKILEGLREKKEQLILDIILNYPKKQKTIEDMLLFYNYVMYLDDVATDKSTEKLIEEIYDLRVKVLNKKNEGFVEQLHKMALENKKEKEEMLQKFTTNDFHLKLSTYKGTNNVQRVNLKYDFKLPSIYSNLAIEKAFNKGITNEDKLFVEYHLITIQAINEIIKGDFRKQYIIEFADTLIKKEQKMVRLLNIIDNPAIQEKLNLKLRYSSFLKNKEKIYQIMRYGYKVAIILDDTFKLSVEQLGKLNIFSYILIHGDSDYYDELIKHKNILRNVIEL